jgi:hypothetical protein
MHDQISNDLPALATSWKQQGKMKNDLLNFQKYERQTNLLQASSRLHRLELVGKRLLYIFMCPTTLDGYALSIHPSVRPSIHRSTPT